MTIPFRQAIAKQVRLVASAAGLLLFVTAFAAGVRVLGSHINQPPPPVVPAASSASEVPAVDAVAPVTPVPAAGAAEGASSTPTGNSGVGPTASAPASGPAPVTVSVPSPTAAVTVAPVRTDNGLGFTFSEVARASGVTFTHTNSQFDEQIRSYWPWLHFMGPSVAVSDVNSDGWTDFYVTDSGPNSQNALYLNQGNGTFVDVAAQAGVADENRPEQGMSVAASWGDYDNDGCPDLAVVKWGYSELFRNDCRGSFTRVTDQAGLRHWANTSAALWVDVNRDGCLDLYLTEYFRAETNLWHLQSTRFLSDDAEHSRNGGRNRLYVNHCDGTFREEGKAYRVDDTGWALAATTADFNGDGWPDLYVANDFGPDTLYLNEGSSSFRKVKAFRGVGDDTFKGMSVDVGDYDNDGRPDLYISNITKPGFLLEGNLLWHNEGSLNFTNTAWDVGAARCGWSWGAKFADLNLDGWPDIFAVNGMISGKERREAWFESGTMSGTPYGIVDDAANYPPIGTESVSGYEPSCLFLNSGKGTFTDVALQAGITDLYDGRGVATADLDNNGSPDLIVANQGQPLLIYRNTVSSGNHWLQLQLVGSTPSCRDAIGARVTITAGGLRQVQEVTGGHSFAGQSDPRLLFGLGTAHSVDSVEIRWPSGRVQTMTGLAANQLHVITEPK